MENLLMLLKKNEKRKLDGLLKLDSIYICLYIPQNNCNGCMRYTFEKIISNCKSVDKFILTPVSEYRQIYDTFKDKDLKIYATNDLNEFQDSFISIYNAKDKRFDYVYITEKNDFLLKNI